MINHGFILILGALALIAIHVFRPRHVNREHTFVILGGAAIGFLIVVLVTSLVIWSLISFAAQNWIRTLHVLR